jgi:hypothetical protein
MGAVSGVASLVSHDFYENTLVGLSPDPAWEDRDLAGDCTISLVGSGTSNSYVRLATPATNHAYGATVGGQALLQSFTADTNWEVEISVPVTTGTNGDVFGFVVTNSDWSDNFTYNAYYSGGVWALETQMNGSFWNDSGTITPQTPFLMRLGYNYVSGNDNDTWACRYWNGSTWTTWVTETFDADDSAPVLSKVGIFVANFNPYPAQSRDFDYFFDISNPVSPEDSFSSLPGSTSRIMVIT